MIGRAPGRVPRKPDEGAGAARPRSLRQRALACLARKEWSRAELAARLLAGGGELVEVDALLDEFEQAGYLSDARFAAALVRSKAAAYAPRAIERKLREHGVEREVAQAALSSLDEVEEIERARALWLRRFGEPPSDEREKARQVRFLVARGYSPGIAYRVIKAASG